MVASPDAEERAGAPPIAPPALRPVILPKKNEKDLVEVPAEIKDELKFVAVRRMDEVLNRVLGKRQLAQCREALATRLAAEREKDKAERAAAALVGTTEVHS